MAVIHELFEEFHIVFEYRIHYPAKGLVMLDTGVLFVGIVLRVLIGCICRDPGRDIFSNRFVHLIAIDPWNIAKLVMKGPEDI